MLSFTTFDSHKVDGQIIKNFKIIHLWGTERRSTPSVTPVGHLVHFVCKFNNTASVVIYRPTISSQGQLVGKLSQTSFGVSSNTPSANQTMTLIQAVWRFPVGHPN